MGLGSFLVTNNQIWKLYFQPMSELALSFSLFSSSFFYLSSNYSNPIDFYNMDTHAVNAKTNTFCER